jgi:hypothetical protein
LERTLTAGADVFGDLSTGRRVGSARRRRHRIV